MRVWCTVDPATLDGEAMLALADELAALGVRRWSLQRRRGCAGRPDPLDDAHLLANIGQRFEALSIR